ncbi:MAG: alpha/beta hydrolase [Gammaproteobacteria bacterium]|nr:alpha/beta hydrolase [Gammaproteobacteria bacterium]
MSTALLLLAQGALAAETEFRLIEGGGGVPLAMVEWGNRSGPGIVLLHGFGFSSEFWLPQMASPELDSFHIVALDLRGHGASAKPWKVAELVDTRLWAEDVAAAIAAAGLQRPVVVGWSYGGFVAMDYVRHFGTAEVAGLMLVASPAGLTERLHPQGADLPGGPAAYQAAAAQRESLSTLDNIKGNEYLAELMTAQELPDTVLRQWTAQLMRIPVYVTRGLRQGRSLENKDLLGALELPVALVVGGNDKSMPFTALEALADEALPAGEYRVFPAAGHAVSTDAAAEFNAYLRDFVRRVNE